MGQCPLQICVEAGSRNAPGHPPLRAKRRVPGLPPVVRRFDSLDAHGAGLRAQYNRYPIRYRMRYPVDMPALNVEFTEAEMDAIREAATREDKPMKTIAHDAVLAEVHRHRVAVAAARVARISVELNKRLADQ